MPDSRSAARPNGLTYRRSGVDIAAGNSLVKAIAPLAAATRRPGADAELGGFGGLFDLKAAGFKDPILVSGTDGVGTKLALAFATGIHDTIGVDLVAMCVNDVIAQGAEPLFFLDYFATGHLETDIAEQVVAGIAEGCRQAGCALIGGETAEMPGHYDQGTYDLAGFTVGAAERGSLLPRSTVSDGDIVIAVPSSGVHSNGYSLVQAVVDLTGLALDHEAPFATGSTLGRALLEPTRIYASVVTPALRDRVPIKALAHITGGGIVENLPRALPEGSRARIDLAALPALPVFGWLARAGGIATDEMLRTFNCGAGMMAVAEAGDADAVVAALSAIGCAAVLVGTIEGHDGPATVIFDGAPAWER